MSRQDEVLAQLRQIMDPDLGDDLVSLGFIKNLQIDGGQVSFTIELTTPACPVKERFESEAQRLVGELPWVERVEVAMSAQARQARGPESAGPGLAKVQRIVAVASCKGGVGKSTVAVNLAFMLARQGARVGLFDADVYGPSLPTMVGTPVEGLYQQEGLIVPYEYQDVKLMSYGFANVESQAAIMRGPMVSNVLSQLVGQTDWGELDYLVIDFPPGTGDTQLTLCQVLPITAAVIVTTPQMISFIDVVKGIQAFDKLKVPTVAVVENMTSFVCDNCGKEHRLFGQGAGRRLTEEFGFPQSLELPLLPAISASGDRGRPYVTETAEGPVFAKYEELAASVVQEIAKLRHGKGRPPSVTCDDRLGIVVNPPEGDSLVLEPRAVRLACRCANCVHEMTGEAILDPDSVPDDVKPTRLEPLGNYAISVAWSDGHASIYPYEMLVELAAE